MYRFFLIIFLIIRVNGYSQKADTLEAYGDTSKLNQINKNKLYSKARRAAIFSACLPGLGQAYNKKYWKIPIIYAGFTGFGYLFYTNNVKYNTYRHALIISQDTANHGYAAVNGINWSTSQLQVQKVQFKKYRDIGAIGLGIIYLLNIIDANVDGHLKTFDVSDDLSLYIDPWQQYVSMANSQYKTVYGVSLKLNFK